MGNDEHEGQFHLISVCFPLLLHLHLFMHQGEIEIYQGVRPCLCRLHGSKFWKRSCSLKPLGQEVMRKFEREREGWQMLWCAEIDNIKGSLTKTHFLATTQARSCVTGWYNRLDECEADGCRLKCLHPRVIWDTILENVHKRTIKSLVPFLFKNNYLSFYEEWTLHAFTFIRDDSKQILCLSCCQSDGNSSKKACLLKCITWLGQK